MLILSWRKSVGPRIVRIFWSNAREGSLVDEKEQGEDSSHSIQRYWSLVEGDGVLSLRTSTIRWLHLTIVMFVNPDEFWRSKTEIFEYDRRMCLGTLHSYYHSWVAIENYSGRSLAKLEARDEAKKQMNSEHRGRVVELNRMESVFLDLGYFILIFCLGRMELRRETWARGLRNTTCAVTLPVIMKSYS